MNPRRLIMALLIALTMSGVFTYWLSQRFAKPRSAAVVVRHQYVAAAVNLEAGDVLHPASLNLIEWPEGQQLAGTFAKPEELAGRTVLYPLAAGQPILERQLSAAGSGSGLTVKIPDGMRAISLRSDDVVGVAGFLLPGTHVDALVTYHTLNGSEPMTSMILQDVQVLAVGQKFQPDPEGKAISVDVVTLLVDPDEAERVVLASSQGMMHFVLRNGTDREKVKTSAVQLSELGVGPAPVPATVAPTPARFLRPDAVVSDYVVETVAGNKQSTESFK